MYPQRDDSREYLGFAVAFLALLVTFCGFLYMLQRFLLEVVALVIVRLFGRWMPYLSVGFAQTCEWISRFCCLIVAATSVVLMFGVPKPYQGSESDHFMHDSWLRALIVAIVTQLYASIAVRLDAERPQDVDRRRFVSREDAVSPRYTPPRTISSTPARYGSLSRLSAENEVLPF